MWSPVALLVASACLLHVVSAQDGSGPSGQALNTNPLAGYACNPTTCKPPNCTCASLTPPVANPPQFLLLTFDDAMELGTWNQTQTMLSGRKNPNGCPVPATWFVSVNYTDPYYITQWYAQGNEVADHTITHDSPFCATYPEIEGNRGWMNAYGGLPLNHIKGFRHPFLNYSVDSINLLAKMGFEYESSQSAMTADNVWPYTLDYGAVTDCQGQTTICGKNISAAGMWEIPMYGVTDPTGGMSSLMDPYNEPDITNPIAPNLVTSNYENIFDTMHYNTNRAPFGVYTHPVWLGPLAGCPVGNTSAAACAIPDGSAKLKAVTDFLDYALAKPNKDVWMVTNYQLVQYMRNPVPASEMAAQPYMSCTPNPAPPTNICNGLPGSVAPQSCNLNSGLQRSCYGCPTDVSTTTTPIPANTTAGCRVPTTCDTLWWDPVGCTCLCTVAGCAPTGGTARPFNMDPNSLNAPSASANGTSGSGGTPGSGKNSSNSAVGGFDFGEMVGVVVAAVAVLLL